MPTMKCYYCDCDVHTEDVGVYRRLVGWVRQRERGGTNSITLASPPLAWACKSCIDIRRLKGADWDGTETGSLF